MTEQGQALVGARQAAVVADIARVRGILSPADKPKDCSTLCPMEVEVLRLVGLGLTNTEIGEAWGIKANTVRTYAKRLHDKTAIKGRARLAVVASRVE